MSETRDERIERIRAAIATIAGEPAEDVAEALKRFDQVAVDALVREAAVALLVSDHSAEPANMVNAFAFVDRNGNPSMRLDYVDDVGARQQVYAVTRRSRVIALLLMKVAGETAPTSMSPARRAAFDTRLSNRLTERGLKLLSTQVAREDGQPLWILTVRSDRGVHTVTAAVPPDSHLYAPATADSVAERVARVINGEREA